MPADHVHRQSLAGLIAKAIAILAAAALLAGPATPSWGSDPVTRGAAEAQATDTPCGTGWTKLADKRAKWKDGTKIGRMRLYSLSQPDDFSIVTVKFCGVIDQTDRAKREVTDYKLRVTDPDGTMIEGSGGPLDRSRTIVKNDQFRQEARRAVLVIKAWWDNKGKTSVKVSGSVDVACPDVICANN